MRGHRPHRLLILLAATLLVLGGFALRMHEVGDQDLTFDEVATYFVARQSPTKVISYTMQAVREHPPLYYIGMSLWMRLAGSEEFVLRYPSVLLGTLVIAVAWLAGKRWFGPAGGWWSAVVFALSPFALWAARTARMYAAVMLLAMLTVLVWARWAQRPTRKRWAVLILLMAVGILTHYFVALVWAALTAVLLLAPRQTARIRWAWTGTLAGLGLALALFVAVSPGIRATALSILSSFPLREIRLTQLKLLITELYLMWRDPAHLPQALVAGALTLIGWLSTRPRHRLAAAILAAWGTVSIALMNFVPVDLEGRYLIAALPALLYGLAAGAALVRPDWLRWLIGGVLILGSVAHWEQVYNPLEGTFESQVDFLNAAACPGDGVLFNGPWPALSLNYYPPTVDVRIASVPAAAPPGFNAEADIPRLEALAAAHERLWVFYGAIQSADPSYAVSRWLAEHMHAVYETGSMALYVQSRPLKMLETGSIAFGEHLTLSAAALDRTTAMSGDILQVALTWHRHQIEGDIQLDLGLLDQSGQVWANYSFRMGPLHRPTALDLPDDWVERRGLWIQPGLPPARYSVAIRVAADGGQIPEASQGTWITLGTLEIHSSSAGAQGRTEAGTSLCISESAEVLPNETRIYAQLGDALRLTGVQPWGRKATSGYPVGFNLWWTVLESPGDLKLRVRLVGNQTIDLGTPALGADNYPSTAWQVGDTILQRVTATLPDDLTAGIYRVQIQLLDAAGRELPLSGTRRWLTAWERLWTPEVQLQGPWVDLFTLEIEARDRVYTPPPFRTSVDISFGEWLRLRGYRIGKSALHPGESTTLTLYWQAIRRPPQVFAAFNHLRRPGETPIWMQDSWPQQGIYTTNHWLEGEVVAETYTITIPEDAPVGEYPLYIGIYDPTTGDRLPAVARDGERFPSDEVVLCTVTVQP